MLLFSVSSTYWSMGLVLDVRGLEGEMVFGGHKGDWGVKQIRAGLYLESLGRTYLLELLNVDVQLAPQFILCLREC